MRLLILKSIIISGLVLLGGSCLIAQVSYDKEILPQIKKIASVNFSDIEDPFESSLIHVEAPNVSGNSKKALIASIKRKVAQLYPKNNEKLATTRDDALPPTIEAGFLGNTGAGIPLDNALAMNGEQILSAINSNLSIKDPQGGTLRNFSLNQLASEIGLTAFSFDPRLLFDTEAKRFIMVWLSGSNSISTNIVVAFSQSEDATQNWNIYSITGNPNDNMTWTDYPMITVNNSDLVITGNLLRNNETWQEGFDETVLWQINKQNGYDGEDLQTVLYKDIAFDGVSIRNLCPAESSDEVLETNTYFLSNRNFSIESDSFFLVELTGGINDTDTGITIELLQSNLPYGFPPNAEQPVNFLQTNDARVLEIFYHENELQFVGNTRNLTNNKAGIYHGRVTDLTGSRETTIEHIIGADYEIGYPAITYVGSEEGDKDVIINFNHTSPDKNPGLSAMYWHPEDGYSEIIDVWNGIGPVNMISGPLQRWGDYSGSQRDFNDGESCWISGFYGAASANFPYVSKLRKPSGNVSTQNLSVESDINVYPNPVTNRFQVEFEIPQGSKHINISLIDNRGQLVSELLNHGLTKTGISRFSFDQTNLVSGLYHLIIQIDQKEFSSERVIVK